MRVEEIEGNIERRILIGMVTDKAFLSRVAAVWDRSLVASKGAGILGSLASNYYRKHKDAPNANIQTQFEDWSVKIQDQDVIEETSGLLASLSEEFTSQKDVNSDHLAEIAEKHFQKIQLEKHRDELTIHLENGDLDRAQELQAKFKPVSLDADAGIDLFQDADALKDAFSFISKPIILFTGDAGKFLNVGFERDGFIAIHAPSKRGKTMWLMRIAIQGVQNKMRVGFFEVGDLSQRQMLRRFGSWAGQRPWRSPDGKLPIEILYPSLIKRGREREDRAKVRHRKRIFKHVLKFDEAMPAFEEFQKEKIKSSKSYLKLACYPNSTISVQGIEQVLDRWERGGWRADCIIIDYADILAPIDKKESTLDQINTTWKALKTLSQSRQCLVVTASQTNAASFDAATVTRKHFSGNMLKYAHVTGAIGISQDHEERKLFVQRLNWQSARDFDYDENRFLHVAGCPALYDPLVLSCF